jgi:hypothetical protein
LPDDHDDSLFHSGAVDKLKALREEDDFEKQTAILETEQNQPGCEPTSEDPPARPGIPQNKDEQWTPK